MTRYRLTPYNQIDNYGQGKMWKMQKKTIRKRKTQIASAVEEALEVADFGQYNPLTRDSLSCWNPDSIGFNLIEHVLCHICRNERPGVVVVFIIGWDDINSVKDQLKAHPLLGDPSRVLLLACHGSMASAEQKLILDKPEDGIRKIVLATNMAETSITINDVGFVVDCGKAKETSYDAINNTPCLLPSWISKASAWQRKERAGRVERGECYHLYPRCVFEAFADYQLPELLRTPLQSLCLQIKSLQLVFKIPVAPGDIIAGTNGLFDNLYNNDINAIVVHATRAGLGPQVTAQKIVVLARQRAQDKNRQPLFLLQLKKLGSVTTAGSWTI